MIFWEMGENFGGANRTGVDAISVPSCDKNSEP
jgi:hypothetical protein